MGGKGSREEAGTAERPLELWGREVMSRQLGGMAGVGGVGNNGVLSGMGQCQQSLLTESRLGTGGSEGKTEIQESAALAFFS